tara:strand:+ start:1565 stop:1756 length:192 start_codon:yes stop_codon:yes gene_type:complete
MASTEFPHSKNQAAAQVAKLKKEEKDKKSKPKPKAKPKANASGGQMGGGQMSKPKTPPKGRKA